MFNKKRVTKSVVALTLVFTMAGQTQAYGLPVLATGNLEAGAGSVLSGVPSLEEQANAKDTNDKAALSIGNTQSANEAKGTSADAGAQAHTEQTANVNISLTAGAGGYVTATSAIAAEDVDLQTYDDEEAAGGFFGYTNLGIAQVEDHLNIRATAEAGSKIVGKMENDTGCEILGIEGDMAHISSGSVEGYVSTDYLLQGGDAIMYAAQTVKELATVSADGLKLREQPSTDAAVVNMVAYGEELEVLEKLDEWVGVEYDGQKVYVSAEYVDVDKKLKTALSMTEFLYGEGVSDVRVDLCEYAKQFLGNPYVWGGTSLTRGADCSGFVLSVYAKYGISLPHSSRAQANCGTRISTSELKPGDLVFYSNGSRINHVAIYIGGGQVIHASSPKTGIRISGTFYRKPVAAVRILQD